MKNEEQIFTLDQIHEAFKKVKSGADFPQFVQDLKEIGVIYYDNFVADGRTMYYGANDFVVYGAPKYDLLAINEIGSSHKIRNSIAIHQQGKTDYPTFCQQAAEAGVEKWTTHIGDMTVTYLDKNGNKLAIEPIPKIW